MKKVKIVIADDHKIFTNSLKNLLETDDRFDILDEVFNGDDLLQCIESKNPDIVLLDIDMPGKNGLEVLQYFYHKEGAPKFIVVSMYTDDALLKKLENYGADAYLPKNLGKEELLFTIEDVLSNSQKRIISPQINPSNDPFTLLTNREKEILKQIALGKSNQQMADELFCSLFTIQTHRRNIHTKLEIKGQTALVNYVNLNMFRL